MSLVSFSRRAFLTIGSLPLLCGATEPESTGPVVETEEVITRYVGANNGAGPLWCYGAPLVVRDASGVYVSVIETGPDIEPLCNTRWQVWRRAEGLWRVLAMEGDYRQREPCPLVTMRNRGLLLSANPSVTRRGTHYLACRPTVFAITEHQFPSVRGELPAWSESAHFNDHSYRGFAGDGELGEALLVNIDTQTSEQFVSWRDAAGAWKPCGKIRFPIRAAYPQVSLRGRAASVLAIGDIQEPNAKWRMFKAQKTQRKWDYVFRRLFFTFCPDVRDRPFTTPVEIDSVEDTGGHILNLDQYIDRDGNTHLLYLRQPHVHQILRDEFFPGTPFSRQLCHVVMEGGREVKRTHIAAAVAGEAGFEPHFARFHVGVGETLHVVLGGYLRDGDSARWSNWVQPADDNNARQELPLKHPFRRFFTAVPRGGTPPSNTLDLFGTADDGAALRYAAVRLTR